MKHKRTDTPAIIAIAICVAVLLGLAVRADATEYYSWYEHSSSVDHGDGILVRHHATIGAIHRNRLVFTCALWDDGAITIFADILFEKPTIKPDVGYYVESNSIPYLDGSWRGVDTNIIASLVFVDEESEGVAAGALNMIMTDIQNSGGVTLRITSPNRTTEALSWSALGVQDAKLHVVRKCQDAALSHVKRGNQSTGRHGDTPLHTAIRNMDMGSVRSILSNIPHKSHLCNENGQGFIPYQLAESLGFNDATFALMQADAAPWDCRN